MVISLPNPVGRATSVSWRGPTAVSLHSGGFAKVVPGAELVAAAGK
ncbi:hypothetical protein [Streptomyces sp. NPDC005969]